MTSTTESTLALAPTPDTAPVPVLELEFELLNELTEETRVSVVKSFSTIFEEAREKLTIAKTIKVKDSNDKEGMERARRHRLDLRGIRVAGEKLHKELKADSLQRGKVLDAIKNLLVDTLKPVETDLLEQEETAARELAARQAAIRTERREALTQYDFATNADLLLLTDSEWSAMLEEAKTQHEAKLEAKRQQDLADEAERKRKAQAAEDQRLENERLRKQAEADRAEANRLRQEAAKKDADLAAERKRATDAEQKLAQDRKVIAGQFGAPSAPVSADYKQHSAAPSRLTALGDASDKDKLLQLATDLRAMQVPTGATTEAQGTMRFVQTRITMLAQWIETQAQTLS